MYQINSQNSQPFNPQNINYPTNLQTPSPTQLTDEQPQVPVPATQRVTPQPVPVTQRATPQPEMSVEALKDMIKTQAEVKKQAEPNKNSSGVQGLKDLMNKKNQNP